MDEMTDVDGAVGYRNIGWTVGSYCNAHCGQCYSWKVRRNNRQWLTKREVRHIIDQLVRLGISTVNLGGNEPIFTQGADASKSLLPFILRELHEHDIPVGLTTNGTTFWYLCEHHRDELMMVNDIDFSLDSPFAEEHDAGRGAPLFERVVRGVQKSRDLGIDCSIIVCGMKSNFNKDQLSAFLALTKLLQCELRCNLLKPVEPSLVDLMPSTEQFYEGMAFLLANSDYITLTESCAGAVVDRGSAGCPCGTSSFRINGKSLDGRVPLSPCVYLHDFRVGDLLTEDIFEILNRPEFQRFRERWAHAPKKCRDRHCRFLESCRGGCAARAYLLRGSIDELDPYCAYDYMEEFGQLPRMPEPSAAGVDHGVRVHDNYLCTWIGQVKSQFCAACYESLACFFNGRNGGNSPGHGSAANLRQPAEKRSDLGGVKPPP